MIGNAGEAANCDFEALTGAADADVTAAKKIAAAASESAFISIPFVNSDMAQLGNWKLTADEQAIVSSAGRRPAHDVNGDDINGHEPRKPRRSFRSFTIGLEFEKHANYRRRQIGIV
ncbi:hypothetical protein [Nitrobacter sp.]|uniref:hypothetical protein n=1 Tax=Nitrobacter sp. TaxID=29420 RepID=UPI0029CAB3A8|nr:hypothetical protein [Nitrobacter sp.]